MAEHESRSVSDLLKTLINEVTGLFRAEASMVRAEMNDKITQLQFAGGEIAAGAICLLVALFVLSQALVIALGELIGNGWAALAVGVLFAIIGAILLARGRSNLKPSNLTPTRTATQLRKDGALVKEKV